jgi:hypothetical protein
MPKFGKWNPKMSRALGRALGENNDPRRPSGAIDNEDFERGYQAGREAARMADEAAGSTASREDILDYMRDRDSDEAVVDNFDKFIKESKERHGYENWRNEARNKPVDDGLNGEIHDFERESAGEDIYEQMIQDLRNKMDLSDFFDKWK